MKQEGGSFCSNFTKFVKFGKAECLLREHEIQKLFLRLKI